MKAQIKKIISIAIKKLYPSHAEIDFSVDFPSPGIDADFASNVAMVLAKKVGKETTDVAETVAEAFGSPHGNLEVSVTIAPPGFLNFKVSEELLIKNLNKINKKPETYGASNLGDKKLAIVEYFQLNVAKPSHVGHLRSAVIGDALKRILNFVGYSTISDTHTGDWGTQIGIWLTGLKKLPIKERYYVIQNLESSAQVYVVQSELIEKDPSQRDEGKKEFVKLEEGDPENREIWKKTVKVAKKELERQAKQLGLLPFNYQLGESFYEDKMPDILKRLDKKGLLKTGERGEKYVDLEQRGLGRLICVKSDGATTYELRDLATLAYRYDELAKREKGELALNLYVVDTRQSHDFKQIFKTMELLGYDVSKSKHVDFGFMRLAEGAMSTRKGNVVSLGELISEANRRALGIVEEKNPDLKNKEQVAAQVGLGAVKYGDLKHNRRGDIIFDWKEALSFEGNTGPYLQYTHARLCSILRKAGTEVVGVRVDNISETERNILRKLLHFPDIVQDSANEFMPSVIANYLYELSGLVNSFYEQSPVLREKDEKLKELRLALVSACATVIKNGLNLLGITALEEM